MRTLPAAQTLTLDISGTIKPTTMRALQAVPGVKHLKLDAGRLTIGVDDVSDVGEPGGLARTAAAVLQTVADGGAAVRHLGSGRANLEDVFLALTGRQLRD